MEISRYMEIHGEMELHAAESGYSFRRVEGGNKYSDRYLNMFSVGGRNAVRMLSPVSENREV